MVDSEYPDCSYAKKRCSPASQKAAMAGRKTAYEIGALGDGYRARTRGTCVAEVIISARHAYSKPRSLRTRLLRQKCSELSSPRRKSEACCRQSRKLAGVSAYSLTLALRSPPGYLIPKKLRKARSWPCRGRCLQLLHYITLLNTQFGVFSEIYMLCKLLHSSNLVELAKFCQNMSYVS